MYERIKRLFIGQPLSSQMMAHERIGKRKALAVLSSDALSSVAYATEEILIPLAGFSLAALSWSMPIALAIGALLFILTISYRQTIHAYPLGGGAYTVAKENLGVNAGLTAGAALLIDYVLTVSVSVAAGVENIASALPWFQAHKELLGTIIIVTIMVVNLRGVRESASIFALPTYLFIGSILLMLAVGAWKMLTGQHQPMAPIVHEVYPTIPLLLLLRAFSSGCTALTGVEAISNGVTIFKAPSERNAKSTMAWMSLILGSFFLGITLLAHVYGILPHSGETAISALSRKVFEESWLYYLIPVSTALILVLAANTSFADFPRLCSMIAKDRYMPRQLASLGDRLVFSNGIVCLSVAAILLLIFFKGNTHHLIPLYAIGVFTSFTLSQFGMVLHHLRKKQPRWGYACAMNGIGALTTLIVLMVVSVSKFTHGAWIVLILLPAIIIVFKKIHDHYVAVGNELIIPPGTIGQLTPIAHTVVIPISGIHRGVIDSIRYAMSISKDVRACYVELDPEMTERLREEWHRLAPDIPFVVLKSPYRSVVGPLLKYIDEVDQTSHQYMLTVVIPEFMTTRWWHQLLHNHTALMIRTVLKFKRGKVVTSVRYHLR